MARKRPYSVYTEDQVAEAILDITDNGLSQYQASEKWGVPRSTLVNRLKGQTAIADQIQPRRLLTSIQEA